TKDLGSLKYFLGIQVSRSSIGIFLSQRKYCLDLLDDASQIEAKPCDEPMIPKLQLRSEDGILLHNPQKYRRVVGKLNYLTITRPDIAFLGTLGLGILYANHGHHIVEGFIDTDYVGCPNTLSSIMRYCVFVRGNLVSWKSEIGFPQSKPMKMWCDNQAAINISTSPVFHERTKHIEVDCHFTRRKLEDGTITTPHIRTESQLADVITKALPGTQSLESTQERIAGPGRTIEALKRRRSMLDYIIQQLSKGVSKDEENKAEENKDEENKADTEVAEKQDGNEQPL
nr:copia protein [Tanacetum cinerariifolium]